MKVMGVRVTGRNIRYAVLSTDAQGDISWDNLGDEHKWLMPAAATSKQRKFDEAYKEFSRLLNKYQPEIVVLKIAEAFPATARATPERIGIEAVISLAAEQAHIPVTEKRYQQLRQGSGQMNGTLVENYALAHVRRPTAGWDKDLADALAVALKELGK